MPISAPAHEPADGAAAARPAPSSRRRVLSLLAVGAALPLAAWRGIGSAAAQPLRWDGTSMGAPASLTLYHDDGARAEAALQEALAELARMESLFSLFRADSWLSRLNAGGRVDGAPAEFVELMGVALAMSAASQGVFDPTVQPVWQLYYDHCVVQGASEAPAAQAEARARALVNWRDLRIDGRSVVLARAGMGVTLNGVAQGYATDRCTAVLRRHGFDRMLVDMGEPRALEPKPDGSAWRIGLADPREPTRALHTVSVVDRAVATSGGYGTVLDAAGRYTHLIDPLRVRTAPPQESVTVIAPTATLGDALSTALAVMPSADRAARLALLRRFPGCRAVCIDADGVVSELA